MRSLPPVLNHILQERYSASMVSPVTTKRDPRDPDVERGQFNVADPDLKQYSGQQNTNQIPPLVARAEPEIPEPKSSEFNKWLNRIYKTRSSIPAALMTAGDIGLATVAGSYTFNELQPKVGTIPAFAASYLAGAAAPAIAIDAPIASLKAVRAAQLAGEGAATSDILGAGFGAMARGAATRAFGLPSILGTAQAYAAMENEKRRATEMKDLLDRREKEITIQKEMDRAQGIEKPREAYESWFERVMKKAIIAPPPRPTGMEF